MKTNQLSICFRTAEVAVCRDFHQQRIIAKTGFGCGWYVNLSSGGDSPALQFMQPGEELPVSGKTGVVLNFKVDDVDAEQVRLTQAGLETIMPLTDHPWGDPGGSCRSQRKFHLY